MEGKGPQGLNVKTSSPGQSLSAAVDPRYVDQLNSDFYGKIKYPWPVTVLDRIVQKGFWSKMLGQDIGSWGSPIVPENGAVWVAGCGTNQALITALKFPEARVLGSDLSEESLAVCRKNTDSLGVGNLELRRESINDVKYVGEFDYVLCTGVIHHNADPLLPLGRLSRALKPLGVLELMVYNQFHRITTAAFQVAIRTLLSTASKPDLAKELPVARKFVESFADSGSHIMSSFLKSLESEPDAAFCDALLQPVEYSYTVGSLERLAQDCNLEILTFAIDQFSKTAGAVDWNLIFQDRALQEIYDSLPDTQRWQITNHLLLVDSPMLWFYLQRQDAGRPRKTERQICDEFRTRKFQRTMTEIERFVRRQDGTYQKADKRLPFPGRPRDPLAASLYSRLEEFAPLDETIIGMGIKESFSTINKLRINLATSAYPFLEVTS